MSSVLGIAKCVQTGYQIFAYYLFSKMTHILHCIPILKNPLMVDKKSYLIYSHKRWRDGCCFSLVTWASLTLLLCQQLLDRNYTMSVNSSFMREQLSLQASAWKSASSTKKSDSVQQFRNPWRNGFQQLQHTSSAHCVTNHAASQSSKLKATAGNIASASLRLLQETCDF